MRALRGVISGDEWMSVGYEGDDSGEGGDEHECETQVRMSVHDDNGLCNEYL